MRAAPAHTSAVWSVTVYVAFVVDTFSRRIVGWSAATVKETVFILDALEMAIWQRDRDPKPIQPGDLIYHSDAGSQCTSFRLAEHLDAAGIAASIGSVGDAYDNALMEPAIGLYKTELIKPQRPWKTLAQVELATVEWADWYNHRRLHGEIAISHPSSTKPTTTRNSRNPSSQPQSEMSTEPGAVQSWTEVVAERSERQQRAEQTDDVHREDHRQHRDRQTPAVPVQRVDR
ncbi:DDE-type integrase/transposase/recombinase [Streptomyces sp. NPDC008222]|uniref:DDE-type integrase/transposase/recombinase n=1 Tax=Streptomyces sp. NPDC008222 TaxID=3364820 RepID=UPI0036E83176